MEFYATTAQVIPVLLLALTWESNYLNRVKKEDRRNKRVFTKGVVRWWSIFAVTVALLGEAMMVLVLANVVSSGDGAKSLGVSGVGVLIGSMIVRVFSEIWDATKAP